MRVASITMARLPWLSSTLPTRLVSICKPRAWVLSSMALLPAVITASDSTVTVSAVMASLPTALRLTVPCAVRLTSPRSALLICTTVRLASATRVTLPVVPVVLATAFRLMSLRSLLPKALTEVAKMAPWLTTVMAPSATCTACRFKSPALVKLMSPEPVKLRLTVESLVLSAKPLSALAVKVVALSKPPVCVTWPSVAVSLMSPSAWVLDSNAVVKVIEPPKAPVPSSISARPAALVLPDTTMLVPAAALKSPSPLVPVLESPALIHTELDAARVPLSTLVLSCSRLTSLPALMLMVAVE